MAIAQQQSDLRALVLENAKRSRSLFGSTPGESARKKPKLNADPVETQREKEALSIWFHAEYRDVRELPAALAQKQASAIGARKMGKKPATVSASAANTVELSSTNPEDKKTQRLIEGIPNKSAIGSPSATGSTALVKSHRPAGTSPRPVETPSQALTSARAQATNQVKPDWHPPWKLMRVISGHLGWVRSLAVEPENQWFASGAGEPRPQFVLA